MAVTRTYKERRHRPRQCDICGESYHRRNLIEGWTSQNAGHRAGWGKALLRICTRCQGPTATVRTFIMAETSLVKRAAAETSPAKRAAAETSPAKRAAATTNRAGGVGRDAVSG
jgi:hypothetical protein